MATVSCARAAAPRPASVAVVKERKPSPPLTRARRHAPTTFETVGGLTVERDATGQLLVSAVAPDLLTAATVKKLLQGLPVDITWRVHVLDSHHAQPRAYGAFGCRIAYDLWNEIFSVKTTTGQHSAVVNPSGVKRLCLTLNKLALTQNGQLTNGVDYRVVAVAEVNPTKPSLAMLTSPAAIVMPIAGASSGSTARNVLERIIVP